jgi:hypothetical protein
MADGEIVESIRRRSRNTTCESCGENPVWNVQEAELALVEVVDEKLDQNSIVPVHAAVCGTCGFVRLYSTLVAA